MIKLLFILVPLLQLSVEGVDFMCATPDQFEEKYQGLFGQAFQEVKKEKNQIRLHTFLRVKSSFLRKDNYGSYLLIKDLEPKTVVKEVVLSRKNMDDVARDVELSRKVCGHTGDDYSTMLECKSQAILSFYGCVKDDYAVYFFHEPMEQTLADDNIRKQYHVLPALKRAQVILDITDKLIELHRAGIVHNDMKPENIMLKGTDFSDFRILNLRFANYDKKALVTKPDHFVQSKVFQYPIQNTVVSFQNDIYSLGVIFAYLQKYFLSTETKINKSDSNKSNYLISWKNDLEKGIKSVFSQSKGLESFTEVIQKSVKFETKDQFESTENFSLRLLDKFKELPERKTVTDRIESSGKTYDIGSETPSFWRNNLVPKPEGSKPNTDEATRNEPPKPLIWTYKQPAITSAHNQNRVLV